MTPHAKRSLRFRLLLAVLACGALVPGAIAQNSGQRTPTLRQRLNAGLQARRPSEIAFVEAVADTVRRGDLREDLVDRVFFWARTRPQGRHATRRPIIYFQPALQRIAEKGRVTIQSDLEAIASAGRSFGR